MVPKLSKDDNFKTFTLDPILLLENQFEEDLHGF